MTIVKQDIQKTKSLITTESDLQEMRLRGCIRCCLV